MFSKIIIIDNFSKRVLHINSYHHPTTLQTEIQALRDEVTCSRTSRPVPGSVLSTRGTLAGSSFPSGKYLDCISQLPFHMTEF
jgi:hypothetical protein